MFSGCGKVPSLANAASSSVPLCLNRVESSAPGIVSICSVHHQYQGSVSPFQTETGARQFRPLNGQSILESVVTFRKGPVRTIRLFGELFADCEGHSEDSRRALSTRDPSPCGDQKSFVQQASNSPPACSARELQCVFSHSRVSRLLSTRRLLDMDEEERRHVQGVSFDQERWFSKRSYPVKHEVLSGETLFHRIGPLMNERSYPVKQRSTG